MSNCVKKFDDKLRFLDHITLNDLADFFDGQAENCRQKAIQQAFSNDEKKAAGIDFIIRTPRIVMRHLKTGCTLHEAIRKTAHETSVPETSIKNAWKRFCYDKSLYEMKRRNRLILELATMGFSNADIGRKVNLHPNSVSRIITRARKDYHSGVKQQNRVHMILRGGFNDNLIAD